MAEHTELEDRSLRRVLFPSAKVQEDTPSEASAEESTTPDNVSEHSGFEDLSPATRDLLVELRRTINDGSKYAHFTCGGSIPIVDPSVKVPESDTTGEQSAAKSAPVLLYWDSTNRKALASKTKLTFPISVDNLAQLVSDVQPASFGRGGEDVYDESYRKASKLDPTAFATSFNPYDLGIIDVVTQVLLPSADSSVGRGVRAELYKLNIYAAPSGMFKSHVDTPRSGTQFGSLVVCLPVAHEGGQLVVRHDNKEMTFDWSTAETDPDHANLHWAAFYSDCEHEVKEVTSGHRVTLTYNLYAVPKGGRLAGNCAGLLDPAFLPLTHYVRAMVVNPDFLQEGGHIGIPCTHAYPYTDPVLAPMPAVLKGMDMVVFEAFRSLGLTVRVRPVIPPGDLEMGEKGRIGGADKFRRWDSGYNDQYEGYLTSRLLRAFEGREVKYAAVTWLTDSEKAEQKEHITYMAYGNDASVGTMYSHCAIIIEVPDLRSRAEMFPEMGDDEEMGDDAEEEEEEEVSDDEISEMCSRERKLDPIEWGS